MLNSNSKDGTGVDIHLYDPMISVSQTIAKPIVGRSLFKYMEVKEFLSGKVIKRMDLSDKSIRDIDKIEDGLNRNLNHEKYYTFYWDSEKQFDTI